MSSTLRIAVTGLAATYPLGGVFWDYMQYVLGFKRLGHDVLYIEDTGRWCYQPTKATFVESGEQNAAFLLTHMTALDPDLRDRWFFRDATGREFGRPWKDVVTFCKEADLFVHLSASCWMRDEYFAASRLAFVDSDPMYTQGAVLSYLSGSADGEARARVEMLKAHDVLFTFAENIGAPDCKVPVDPWEWIPTRQPVVVDCFRESIVLPVSRRPVLTTVASWEAADDGFEVDGAIYRGKRGEFERFIRLPSRSVLPLELALSGRVPAERLRRYGWRVKDAYVASRDPWVYRSYLASSSAEWSVAKDAYVLSRSGWFSCRSACYLAAGVPAIVQDTGRMGLPSGAGLLRFATLEQAADAIDEVARQPDKHARAALDLAEEYLNSDKVLSVLIDSAFGEKVPQRPARRSPPP
ncbi:MAG: glycosyltransferase family 1 protein [Actinomycetota bacterium]|nr:glycosyltransferase family 1 protein [Actinomycetota bacterium]